LFAGIIPEDCGRAPRFIARLSHRDLLVRVERSPQISAFPAKAGTHRAVDTGLHR
jgi:hypothetical protein